MEKYRPVSKEEEDLCRNLRDVMNEHKINFPSTEQLSREKGYDLISLLKKYHIGNSC